MREILFRGKRISNGEWVYGGINKVFHPNYDCDNGQSFFEKKPNCYCICSDNKDVFVEQKSIGQYTGIKDKNGKKIFEGDIVCQHYEKTIETPTEWGEYGDYDIIDLQGHHIGEVKYDRYNGFCISNPTSYDDVNLCQRKVNAKIRIATYRCEVIGNIFDNPELLLGGDE